MMVMVEVEDGGNEAVRQTQEAGAIVGATLAALLHRANGAWLLRPRLGER